MANERPAQQSDIKLLISKGLEQGYLTYAEVNDHLPDDMVDPEQIEDIIGMINGMGIDVHEVAPDAETLLLAGESSGNREGLGIEVDFSLPAERVVRALNQIIEWRGKPMVIRVDNGPEYISATLAIWAAKQGIALTHIQPGKPQQNAYVERYNRTVRHEWLDLYIFETIAEAQSIATDWLWTYNNERPNMGIGGITPAQKLKMAA